MLDERRNKLIELRKKIANLSKEQRETLSKQCVIANMDGHVLSNYNTIMLYFQASGIIPTIVAGYNQWKTSGKQVKKGEHGYTILFPAGPKSKDDEGNETIQAEHFYCGTVFDITQVEPILIKERELVTV
jgi:hypothetical protein